MYIYLITNTINGKYYVGQTIRTVEKRWREHLKYSKQIEGKSTKKAHLYNSMRTHGSENFKIETLCECPDIETLNSSEKFFVSFTASYKPSFGYNQTMGGNNALLTERAKANLSLAHKTSTKAKAHREVLRISQIGRSPSNKGQKASQEAIAKQIAASRGRKRKPLSEETKNKIGRSNRGRKRTPEQILNIVAGIREGKRKRHE